KKIFCVAVAAAMLTQIAAFAAPTTLKQYVADRSYTNQSLDANGVFDYSKKYGNVTVKVTAQAKGDSGSYQDTTASSPLSLANNSNSFSYKVNLDMENVRNTFDNLYESTVASINANDPTLLDKFKNSTVSGKFYVDVVADAGIKTDASGITYALSQTGNTVSNIFKFNASDVTTVSSNSSSTKIRIPFSVVDGMTVQTLKDNPVYLNDLSFEVSGVSVTNYGTSLKVTGALSDKSSTEFTSDSEVYAKINFNSNDAAAYVRVAKSTGGSGKGSGTSSNKTYSNISVELIVDGNVTSTVQAIKKNNQDVISIDSVKEPYKEGYVFEGWYDNAAFAGTPLTGDIAVKTGDKLYAKFINVRTPDKLDSVNHINYIAAYPDGTVRPNRNISREEVASIFYRLLTPEFKATVETNENSFTDVSSDRWSNIAISTMAKAGLVVGLSDGKFDPESPMTRAQFVTLVSNLVPSDDTLTNIAGFTDISGHWAEKNIITASNRYWISGYPDQTFRPDAYITRAEAITIVNRVLVRYLDATGNCDGAENWSDNASNAWYYYQILEATNTHNFTRLNDGYHESWTK
ncbi:MAG: S-layer homology domain-containing protein, partial [Firmicutes bacterium]|nr:S-layer homology domain-containing protein [Bacillota bacterium]